MLFFYLRVLCLGLLILVNGSGNKQLQSLTKFSEGSDPDEVQDSHEVLGINISQLPTKELKKREGDKHALLQSVFADIHKVHFRIAQILNKFRYLKSLGRRVKKDLFNLVYDVPNLPKEEAYIADYSEILYDLNYHYGYYDNEYYSDYPAE